MGTKIRQVRTSYTDVNGAVRGWTSYELLDNTGQVIFRAMNRKSADLAARNFSAIHN